MVQQPLPTGNLRKRTLHLERSSWSLASFDLPSCSQAEARVTFLHTELACAGPLRKLSGSSRLPFCLEEVEDKGARVEPQVSQKEKPQSLALKEPPEAFAYHTREETGLSLFPWCIPATAAADERGNRKPRADAPLQCPSALLKDDAESWGHPPGPLRPPFNVLGDLAREQLERRSERTASCIPVDSVLKHPYGPPPAGAEESLATAEVNSSEGLAGRRQRGQDSINVSQEFSGGPPALMVGGTRRGQQRKVVCGFAARSRILSTQGPARKRPSTYPHHEIGDNDGGASGKSENGRQGEAGSRLFPTGRPAAARGELAEASAAVFQYPGFTFLRYCSLLRSSATSEFQPVSRYANRFHSSPDIWSSIAFLFCRFPFLGTGAVGREEPLDLATSRVGDSYLPKAIRVAQSRMSERR
ncbi:Proline-rich protein 32 [Camelus dromedarius]|uniref:Proline-rich protein 32 n=1 Tax=Camelus dromedarius TaxID=9838 RepID=A0A5N4C0X5_CAMDR|nr:Proline-rich protein 32 [Camelus dromedarius]